MAKTVTAAELQERWPAVLEELEENGEEVLITNHGRPVARVVAVDAPPAATLESLRLSGRIIGDIEESTGDEWDEER